MSSLDRVRATLLTLACLLTTGACGETKRSDVSEDGAATGGTVLIALVGTPKTLLPALLQNEHEQAIVEVLYDRLAEIGPSLDVMALDQFTPRLASAWTWSTDSLSIAFTLDARVRWHDGAPLVANDVVRTFALYTDPIVGNSAAALLENVDSVTARDASTAVFWFKRRAPQQLYDAVHHLLIMPSHLLADADPSVLAALPLSRAPVGTGRFRFLRWTSDGRIELIADTANVRGRPSLDRVIYEPVQEAGAALVKLLAGESDFAVPLMAQTMDQVAASETIRTLVYPSLRYQLLTFNLRTAKGGTSPHPVLGDVSVRRALAMASNVERVVRTVFDSLGAPAIGPVPRLGLPDTNAVRPIAYNPAAARALLDSAGWLVSGPDSLRRRNGVPLRVEVMVPAGAESRVRMAVLLQDQWRAVGAELVVQRLELQALIERFNNADYEAVTNGWTLSPGLVGLRQAWTTPSIGGGNYASYSSAVVDANVDSMLRTFDAATRTRTLERLVQTLIDDAPAIWLVEDKVLAGMHRRIRPGTLSALGWWHGLAQWQIAPDQRLDRDRIGLVSAP
jgi:peptide/nickel transport system substrate-binding protein